MIPEPFEELAEILEEVGATDVSSDESGINFTLRGRRVCIGSWGGQGYNEGASGLTVTVEYPDPTA